MNANINNLIDKYNALVKKLNEFKDIHDNHYEDWSYQLAQEEDRALSEYKKVLKELVESLEKELIDIQ